MEKRWIDAIIQKLQIHLFRKILSCENTKHAEEGQLGNISYKTVFLKKIRG